MNNAAFVTGDARSGGAGWFKPRHIYYVRLSEDRISLRNAVSGREVEDVPVLAVDARGQILTVGADAAHLARQRTGEIELVSPFAPASFGPARIDHAGRLLNHLVRRLDRNPFWSAWLTSGLVIHPDPDWLAAAPAGSMDLFPTLARPAGLGVVHPWDERRLTDEEVMHAVAPAAFRLGL